MMTPLSSTLNVPSPAWRRVQRVLRAIGRTLAALVGLIVVLGLVGAVYESAAEAADVRAYLPPGQLVDVGGYRLHINCTGTGSPTVVIDAGWGDWSGGWSRVQPEAAKTTRVCTYDRAGMGDSEAGPLPRTAEQFAKELHTLLQHAAIPSPYVLVGHSMGGAPVRVFAHTYAAEVAGVVLIESMNPGEVGTPARATTATPPDSGAVSIINRLLTNLLTLPARVGLVRFATGSVAGLSPDDANAYTAHSVTVRALQAAIDEGRGMQEGLVFSHKRLFVRQFCGAAAGSRHVSLTLSSTPACASARETDASSGRP
jgi:pimeloyl-ACP methyl ester carboxylesterase